MVVKIVDPVAHGDPKVKYSFVLILELSRSLKTFEISAVGVVMHLFSFKFFGLAVTSQDFFFR